MENGVDDKKIAEQIAGLRVDIKSFGDRLTDHAKSDKEFQDKAEPVIEMISEMMSSGKFLNKIVKWIFYFLISVGTIIYGVKLLFIK
jgi:hypothetical protein